MSRERLHKVLAHAGVASRRTVERWIREGRIEIDGRRVDRPGARVDPARETVSVNGRRIDITPEAPLYLVLNKPPGCVTTLSDPRNRRTIRDLLRGIESRVYPVGRLDYHSEGLLLVTNDGTLARDLMHPRCGVPKLYRVKVRGTPDYRALERMRRGVRIEGRMTHPTAVRLAGRTASNTWLEITVTEGRKHLVRKLCRAAGHPVMRLLRVGYGELRLGDLAPGRFRLLTRREVDGLRRAVEAGRGRRPRPGGAPAPDRA